MSGFVKNNVTCPFWVFLQFVLKAVRTVTNILFQEFIPYMAKKYNFQYEFVQYKWPRWLHQQTEKQRIIWGYKILFLDVLFPLAVDKFLFVDADQVSAFEDSNITYFKCPRCLFQLGPPTTCILNVKNNLPTLKYS